MINDYTYIYNYIYMCVYIHDMYIYIYLLRCTGCWWVGSFEGPKFWPIPPESGSTTRIIPLSERTRNASKHPPLISAQLHLWSFVRALPKCMEVPRSEGHWSNFKTFDPLFCVDMCKNIIQLQSLCYQLQAKPPWVSKI